MCTPHDVESVNAESVAECLSRRLCSDLATDGKTRERNIEEGRKKKTVRRHSRCLSVVNSLRAFFPKRFCIFHQATMACGATLKRSMEFEALHSPQSPKRRRCNPMPGTPANPSPQRCNLLPANVTDNQSHSMSSPPATAGEHRLTPGKSVL